MISKPINSFLKSKFQEIHKAAIEKANTDLKDFQIKINSFKNHFDRYKLLCNEQERLDNLKEKHAHPYYIEYHSSPDWLLEQFASRCFLLNVDEGEELAEAIYLGCYSWDITQIKIELRKDIPEYTYEYFLNGQVCKYFSAFGNEYNMSRDDYYEIRNWQTERLVKIVDYECQVLIKNIQQYCKSISDPLAFILEEKEKIEAIDKEAINAQMLKKKLGNLYIYKDFDCSTINSDSLEKNFELFLDGRIAWNNIFPFQIEPLLAKIDRNFQMPLGAEFTLFFVINKVADWIELILNGQPIQQEVISTDWNILFNKALQEAMQFAEESIEPIEEFAYNVELPQKDVKDYLIEKLELYRIKFNAFEKKYLFALLEEKNRPLLKNTFITNAFLGNNLQKEFEAIKEAIVIQEMSWDIVNIYGDIFNTHKIDYPEKTESYLEIMDLMNQMVLDKELYNELRASMDDFMQHFHSYLLPIEMHFQNQRETLSDLFRKSLKRLETHLNDAEPSNKILYLQSRIKDLRHQELYYKQIKHELNEDNDALRYPSLFKEFLEIEADFIKNIKDIDRVPEFTLLPKKQLPLSDSRTKTFDEIFPGEKGRFVLQLLEDLSITVEGSSQLTPKRVGAIRGVIDALLQNQIAPQLNIRTLCSVIADKTGTPLKSGKIDASKTSNFFFKRANQYISTNYRS